MQNITLEFTNEITSAGLSKDQAVVYETLLKLGEAPASIITKTIPVSVSLSRPLVYKVLSEISELGLVQRHEIDGKVTIFSAEHPFQLKELIARRTEELEIAKTSLDASLGKLLSTFNLLSGKPGVRFFEGISGIRDVINDALTSTTEIYSYIDIDMVEKTVPNISKEFAHERVRLGIKKKNIGIDTPENRKYLDNFEYTEVTEERLIAWPTGTFGTVMQIYDGKISYVTLTDPKIGVIIADPHIYAMHRSLFEVTWNNPLAYIPKQKND